MNLPTPTAVLAEIKRIAEENPDERYTNIDGGVCYYTRTANGAPGPGCIVGRALINLGVPLEILTALDNEGVVPTIRGASHRVMTLGRSTSDYSGEMTALDIIAHIQTRQDYGYTFKEAVARSCKTDPGSPA